MDLRDDPTDPTPAPAGDEVTEAYRRLVAEVYELAGRSRSTSERFAAGHGQTAARWHVLSVVSDGPKTVPEIAARLGLTRQSVQRVVDDLVADRSVRAADNPRHRRSPLIELTDGGAATARRLFEASARARRAQVEQAGVTAAELAAAADVLGRLVAAIDQIDV